MCSLQTAKRGGALCSGLRLLPGRRQRVQERAVQVQVQVQALHSKNLVVQRPQLAALLLHLLLPPPPSLP